MLRQCSSKPYPKGESNLREGSPLRLLPSFATSSREGQVVVEICRVESRQYMFADERFWYYSQFCSILKALQRSNGSQVADAVGNPTLK